MTQLKVPKCTVLTRLKSARPPLLCLAPVVCLNAFLYVSEVSATPHVNIYTRNLN